MTVGVVSYIDPFSYQARAQNITASSRNSSRNVPGGRSKLGNPSSNDYDTLHMPMSNDAAVYTSHYPWACSTSISHAVAKQCFQLFVPTTYLTMCPDYKTCCADAVLCFRQLNFAQQVLLLTPNLTLIWSMMAILLICPSPGDWPPSHTFTLCFAFDAALALQIH